jgi:hypothetical protein
VHAHLLLTSGQWGEAIRDSGRRGAWRLRKAARHVQRKLGFSERRQLQFPAVTDEYTRECHTLIVGRSIKAVDVRDLLEVLFTEHGVPEHIRCESGPELIAQQLRVWLDRQAVKPLYIAPGAPWENGCAESCIGPIQGRTHQLQGVYEPSGGPGRDRGLARELQ